MVAALSTLLPSLNALLNATSGVLLVRGWFAIRSGQREVHRRCMQSAVIVSALFLVSYGVRVALTGTHRFPGGGALKVAYLAILFSHMVLAAAAVPLVLRTLTLARAAAFDRHRSLARWTFPVWLYVSITGVVVYVMLYHLA